jgi:hypothetical protein
MLLDLRLAAITLKLLASAIDDASSFKRVLWMKSLKA